MMNKYNVFLAIGVFVGLFVSCEQYAIFDAISKEVKPKPALIKGSPSKIVKDSAGNLYVANGELWKYSGGWAKISAPDNTRDVATVGNDVYVIAVGDSPSLSKLGGGGIGVSGTVQGIFGANNTLFIAVGNGNSYSVAAYNGSTISAIADVTGLLKGAAHYGSNNYYLATDSGLYHSTSATSGFTSIKSGDFKGVIELSSSKVIAVTESAVYEVTGSTATSKADADSLTGALAAFGDTLYLGRSRGYREVNMTSWSVSTPTMATYTSTIALVRVTAMYAVSADLIFASVLSSEPKRSGLMSLRGGWNMEE
ncbi:MAG: hypothetical protein LBT00_11055 [Spirochaetaceae bacterium]|jgi:hypothetical protein|nr:hypothetical protein [Spirochaetaceae bacterium]